MANLYSCCLSGQGQSKRNVRWGSSTLVLLTLFSLIIRWIVKRQVTHPICTQVYAKRPTENLKGGCKEVNHFRHWHCDRYGGCHTNFPPPKDELQKRFHIKLLNWYFKDVWQIKLSSRSHLFPKLQRENKTLKNSELKSPEFDRKPIWEFTSKKNKS